MNIINIIGAVCFIIVSFIMCLSILFKVESCHVNEKDIF